MFIGHISMLLRGFDPAALIEEGDGEQNRAEDDEGSNAVASLKSGAVVEEYLGTGDCQQHNRLPTQECRLLPESNKHESAAVEHPDGRVSEVARDVQAAPIRRVKVLRPLRSEEINNLE